MLSRMAASLYWIGRYVERAEQTARITDVTFNHTLAMGSTPEAEARRRRHWQALLDIVGERPAFAAAGEPLDDQLVRLHVTLADDNPNSILNCIRHARENARTMRHQIATEMWEVLNAFHLELQRPAQRRRAMAGGEGPARFWYSVVEFSHRFQGVTDSTMPREEGWYFLQAGKFLERAEKTARALDVNFLLLAGDDGAGGQMTVADAPNVRPPPAHGATPAAAGSDPLFWANVLRSLAAYESYHRVTSTGVHPRGVIELLTLSPVVPRSIHFALAQLDAALRHITEEAPAYNGSERLWASRPSEARREVGRLHGELAYQRVDDLFEHGLHPYLLDLQRRCYRIGEQVEDEFFSHRPLLAHEVIA